MKTLQKDRYNENELKFNLKKNFIDEPIIQSRNINIKYVSTL